MRDSKSGDVIIKLVNTAPTPMPISLVLQGAGKLASSAKATVLAGDDPKAVDAQAVSPKVAQLPVAPTFDYQAPANSLTVIRIPQR